MILGTNLLDLMGGIVLDHEVITEEVKVVNLEVAEQTQNTINLFQNMMDEMYTECKDAENMDVVLEKHRKDIEKLNQAIQLKDIHIKPENGYIKGYWNGFQVFYVSLGNAKLAPDAYGNGFMIWSVVGKVTCNGKTDLCAKNCYNCAKSFEKNVKSKIRNTIFSQLDCFEDAMVKVAKMTPYAKNTYFRIHEDGDFFNGEYTKKWFNIAERLENENIKFMAYTKEPNLLEKINQINAECKNMMFRFSVMEDTSLEVKKYIIENKVPTFICLGDTKVDKNKPSKRAKEIMKMFNMVNPNNRCKDNCATCKKCYYNGINQVVTMMHK